VPLDLEPKPLIVAEEMNTTTRVDHFRKLVQAKKYDDILTLAKKLVNEGSHMLDLCCAIVGEDEKGYISAILERIATRVPAPILIDSTEADVVEEALKRIPGKSDHQLHQSGGWREADIESVADGEALRRGGHCADHRRRRHGADRGEESGNRASHLRSGDEKYGIRPVDLIFDALTLPISTGQEEYRSAGTETLKAVRRSRRTARSEDNAWGQQHFSFGLDAYPRRVLNSVFMHEAVDHGLDMAIVNYTKIYPLYKIPQEEVDLARKLIYQRPSNGDPLQVYMQHFAGREREGAGATTAHVGYAVGRRQAEVRDHQRREIGWRGRPRNQPGRVAGRSARRVHAARPDQHGVA
jgi:5-methyltetrahydrofolate--homocysteine methyltransferase